MPPPGDPRPARIRVALHDPIWEALYLPVTDAIAFTAERLNHLQCFECYTWNAKRLAPARDGGTASSR
jgi:hypothetical protein